MLKILRDMLDSDSEFLEVMLFFDRYIQKRESRIVYIPKTSYRVSFDDKNKRKYLDLLPLKVIFDRYGKDRATIKLECFTRYFGGKALYVPVLSSVYKELRDRMVLNSYGAGFSYQDIKKCFDIPFDVIRRILLQKI